MKFFFTSHYILKGNNLLRGFFVLSVFMLLSSCSKDDNSDKNDSENIEIFIIAKDIDERTVLSDLRPGVDYKVCGLIKVNDELIIQSGVSIKMCAGAKIEVRKDGSLKAVGTTELPISITGEEASPGYWKGIRFYSDSPNNILNHVEIRHGGGGPDNIEKANVFVGTYWQNSPKTHGQLTIKNSVVGESENYGLVVAMIGGTLTEFSNNTFSNNGNAGIVVPATFMGLMDTASDYADGNENNYIEVRGDDINHDQIVKATNAPFYIRTGFLLFAGMTLKPGVNFLMGRYTSIIVEDGGYLQAVGTANAPITMKGMVKEPGYWDGIVFFPGSDSPNNKLEYVEIRHGGGAPNRSANVNVLGALTMYNCIISDSGGWGLYVDTDYDPNVSPSTKQGILDVNTFSNNGNGSPYCEGACNVLFE